VPLRSRRKLRRSVSFDARLNALGQAREADVRRASTRHHRIVEHFKFIQELFVTKRLKSSLFFRYPTSAFDRCKPATSSYPVNVPRINLLASGDKRIKT
jgi:hypothetical protein